uniref:Uncharacterized protein n=1 Tax=Anguilla anguilla TaxID=7936 RepID=A0A0E9RWK6_ANGAN
MQNVSSVNSGKLSQYSRAHVDMLLYNVAQKMDDKIV